MAAEIMERLRLMAGSDVFVPEFTWQHRRIDAVIVDVHRRRVRGFEVKVTRSDFLHDTKWTDYAEFCSTLAIVCPEGLIDPSEVGDPFGVLYMTPTTTRWAKRAKEMQTRTSLAWLYTYVGVIEREFPRLVFELETVRRELSVARERAS